MHEMPGMQVLHALGYIEYQLNPLFPIDYDLFLVVNEIEERASLAILHYDAKVEIMVRYPVKLDNIIRVLQRYHCLYLSFEFQVVRVVQNVNRKFFNGFN